MLANTNREIKRHASIRRPVWPSGYDRLIPAVPPDDADEKGRARDGGHEGGRSQNSVTDFLRVNKRFWDANWLQKQSMERAESRMSSH